MTMKNILLFLLLLLSPKASLPLQHSLTDRTITGIVIDELSKEPLIFANVILPDCGEGVATDLDGRFSISVPDSCHWLEVNYTGYSNQRFNIDNLDSLVVEMSSGISLQAVVVVEYRIPHIECDNTTQGSVMTAEQIRNLPAKNINAIAATTAGLSSKNGKDVNIRGSRANATDYYVDGIRVNSGHKQKNGKQKDPAQNTSFNSVPVPLAPQSSIQYQTENYSLIVENTFHHPQDAPLSTFSIDVDGASYANLRRFLTRGELPPKNAVRIEEMINYFDYDYPQPKDDVPFSITTEAGECPWNKEHKLVHIGLQGKIIPANDLPASNLVFLLDVSGSMSDYNKLPLVISSFKLLTEQLRKKDRVAIVVYAGSSGLVLPGTPGDQKDEILSALNRLSAGGSTAGAAGIQLAYTVARQNFIEGGNNRVILATDGDFNVGVSSDAELVHLIEKERESGVFLSVLGFGEGNYMDNKMQELADHGNGNHSYIDNYQEARKVFVNEFGGTLFAIAKDVKIQIEFNPVHVQSYRLIGYENRVLQDVDFNDDKKDAGEIGSGHSVTALYEIIPTELDADLMASIDPLKYQTAVIIPSPSLFPDEWMTVKFRYKDPDGNKSKLITQVIYKDDDHANDYSDNFRWSAAVALFGMLLHESEFAGKGTCEDVMKLATNAMGKDEFGYRKEFIQLVKGISPLINTSK
jgi:Ca-activated chloride channel family protein